MIFYDQPSIAKPDFGTNNLIKQLLQEKYGLVDSIYDPTDSASVAEFSEYFLDLHLLGIS